MNKASLPLVTIAVSAYNHERYIKQCLTSLLQQTYKNVELIVFDDGSTDNTANIIEGFHKTHKFHFEKRPNSGLTPTLNAILKLAKGKYFTVLGSDDIAMLDKTEKQVALMEQDESIALCGGNILKIDQHGTLSSDQKTRAAHELDFKSLMLNTKSGLPAPTLFFRTDILRKVGGYHEEIKLEDVYIALKISEPGHKLFFMNDVLAYYRIHPENTYKNLIFMSDSILATLDQFKSSPFYLPAQQKRLVSLFIKASKRNKPLARTLIKKIKLKNYSIRVAKGVLRLLLP